MSLNINPDIEARLIAAAQASGFSLEDFLRRMIAQTEQARHLQVSPEEWVSEFDVWADSAPETGNSPLPDEALSREDLHPDRL